MLHATAAGRSLAIGLAGSCSATDRSCSSGTLAVVASERTTEASLVYSSTSRAESSSGMSSVCTLPSSVSSSSSSKSSTTSSSILQAITATLEGGVDARISRSPSIITSSEMWASSSPASTSAPPENSSTRIYCLSRAPRVRSIEKSCRCRSLTYLRPASPPSTEPSRSALSSACRCIKRAFDSATSSSLSMRLPGCAAWISARLDSQPPPLAAGADGVDRGLPEAGSEAGSPKVSSSSDGKPPCTVAGSKISTPGSSRTALARRSRRICSRVASRRCSASALICRRVC
mmetsp:Transcript_22093/g.60654  ORF Transcript_22093/g.60654 Transcript_22093/m.60654 type:complete len:289 (-) Transcript_22093:224-1090(-)